MCWRPSALSSPPRGSPRLAWSGSRSISLPRCLAARASAASATWHRRRRCSIGRTSRSYTIFKEQRIEVPLARSRRSPQGDSRHRGPAVLRAPRRRHHPHRRRRRSRTCAKDDGRRAAARSRSSWRDRASSRRDKTLRRKLKEVVLAAELESAYSKDEILELYLNKVYFGDGLHGIEAASRGYFGTHASDLTLPARRAAGRPREVAVRYAPTVNLERAIAPRTSCCRRWWTRAPSRPTRRCAQGARGLEGRPEPRRGARRLLQGRRAAGARRAVRHRRASTKAVCASSRPSTRSCRKRPSGRRELDSSDRGAARRRRKTSQTSQRTRRTRCRRRSLAMDPETGEVRALVGGRELRREPFQSRDAGARQPGSAFKPFVYATALEQGWSPASVVDHLDEPIATLQGDWMPEDEHLDTPEMTLRTALRTSSNRAAVAAAAGGRHRRPWRSPSGSASRRCRACRRSPWDRAK